MKLILATTLAVVGVVNAIAIAEPVQARDARLKGKFRLLCGPRGGACPRSAMPEALAAALDEAQDSDIETRDASPIEARDAMLHPHKFRLLCGPRGGACPRSAIPEALAEAMADAEFDVEQTIEKREAMLHPHKFRLLCGPRGGACPRDAMPEALAKAIDEAEETEQLEVRDAEANAMLHPHKFRLLCGPRGGACPRSAIPEAVATALEAAEVEARNAGIAARDADAKLLKPHKFRLLCGPRGGACPRELQEY